MEARIKRGRQLREILKQERLAPLSSLYQLAWLIAYNENLLKDLEPEIIPQHLQILMQGLNRSTLTLDSDPQRWLQFISDCLSASTELPS